MHPDRTVSGMRPARAMHLGKYHGAVNNWVQLQAQKVSLFLWQIDL